MSAAPAIVGYLRRKGGQSDYCTLKSALAKYYGYAGLWDSYLALVKSGVVIPIDLNWRDSLNWGIRLNPKISTPRDQ